MLANFVKLAADIVPDTEPEDGTILEPSIAADGLTTAFAIVPSAIFADVIVPSPT